MDTSSVDMPAAFLSPCFQYWHNNCTILHNGLMCRLFLERKNCPGFWPILFGKEEHESMPHETLGIFYG